MRRQIASQFTQGQFSTAELHRSLEESLRLLRTDYVDILFLHAAPESVLQQDDLLAEMKKLIDAGKIRFAGISAAPEVIGITIAKRPVPLTAMQFPCNVFDLSITRHTSKAADSGFFFVANNPFGGVLQVAATRDRLRQLAASDELSQELREKLKTADNTLLAQVVLNLAMNGTGIHVVVPAMIKLDHLRTNVEAISSPLFTSQQIDSLRTHLLPQTQAQPLVR